MNDKQRWFIFANLSLLIGFSSIMVLPFTEHQFPEYSLYLLMSVWLIIFARHVWGLMMEIYHDLGDNK